MVFGVILAGGSGTRMGKTEIPKQYINVGDKPIIIHTIKQFVINNNIDKTIVVCPESLVTYTKRLIDEYLPNDAVEITIGGRLRNDTIINAIDYIDDHYHLDDNTIIITHDAVRPFVTQRILNDNLESLNTYYACDTVVSATDTIVKSLNKTTIDSIPDRKYYYQGQTPQSFYAMKFKQLYCEMSDSEKESLTDAAKVFVKNGIEVAIANGETYNIKITYQSDLMIAEAILEKIKEI